MKYEIDVEYNYYLEEIGDYLRGRCKSFQIQIPEALKGDNSKVAHFIMEDKEFIKQIFNEFKDEPIPEGYNSDQIGEVGELWLLDVKNEKSEVMFNILDNRDELDLENHQFSFFENQLIVLPSEEIVYEE